MTGAPPPAGPPRPLLTRRASLECLALLALATTTSAAAAAAAADAPAMSEIERAHAELAGEAAFALGRQIAGVLGPAAAEELLESEAVRFSRCRQADPAVDARGLLGRLAAEDYRANRVLELKGLWLARIEAALLLAPVLQSPVATVG